MREVHGFALVTAPDARLCADDHRADLPDPAVLSHLEIARGVEIKSLGTIS